MFNETMLLDKDGTLGPSERPGLGLTLNEQWFQEHLVE